MLQVCKIVQGQRYSKRLNKEQISALLKANSQRPRDREIEIVEVKHFTFLYPLSKALLNDPENFIAMHECPCFIVVNSFLIHTTLSKQPSIIEGLVFSTWISPVQRLIFRNQAL